MNQDQAAELLRLSETRFRALIENSLDAVALLTAEGRFAYTSPATAQIMGYAPHELVGMRWVRLVHPDDRAMMLRLAAEVAKKPGHKVSAVFRLRHRSGEWRWLEGTSHNLLHEPGVGAIVANYRDVSAAKRNETRLMAFAQLGQRLSAARTTEEAARVVFDIGDQLFGWDACYVDEYAPAENLAFSVLYIDTFDGVRKESVDPVREIGVGPLTQRILDGNAELILREPEERPTNEVKPFGDVSRPSASLMYAPVRYGAEVRAVLSFQSYTYNAYTPEDLETLKAVADLCGGAFDRLRAEARVRRHNEELLTLNEIGRTLSELTEPAETLRRIHGLLGRLLDNRNLFIALYDAKRNVIAFPVYTMDGQAREPAERPFGNGLTEYVIRTRAPLLTGNLEKTIAELGIAPIGRPAQSLLAVPLLAGEEVLGVLCVQDYTRPNAYGTHERDLLSTVALQAAVALANAHHFAAAQQELSERRRTEAALREREETLSKILELLPVGVWLTDLQGLAVLDNPAGQRIWSYAPGSDSRRPYRAWDPQTGQPLRPGEWPVDRALATGEETKRRELEIEAFDGTRKYVLASAVPLRDDEAVVTGTIVVYEDITERRRRERQLEALAALSAVLREAATRATMLPILLDHVLGLTHAAGAGVMRTLPGGTEGEIELAHGMWAHASGSRMALDQSMSGWVVRNRQPMVTDDVRHHPLFARPELVSEQMAGIVLPLVADQGVHGALWVLRPEPFEPGEVGLLAALAEVAANALHRASLHEATLLRADQLAAINALGRTLSETLDLPSIYAELCATGARLLVGVDRIGISLYDAETNRLHRIYALQDAQPRFVGPEPGAPLKPPGHGTQSEVIHTGQPLIVGDLDAYWEDPRRKATRPTDVGWKSGLYVPMLVKGRVIGVLHVQSYRPHQFEAADAELLGLAANTAAIAIENARLFAETERRLHYVQAMHDIDRAITSSLDLRVTLNVLLDHATTQLEVDAAAVLLLNPHLQMLDHAASRGFRTKAIERTHVRLGEGLAGRVALDRRPVLISDLNARGSHFSRGQLLAAEGFASYYAVPLIAKGEVKGVLDVFHRQTLRPTHEWLEFVQTLAGQAAVAIENAGLFNTLQRANMDLSLAYEEVVEGWGRALDVRERGEAGHARRTADLAEQIARGLGLTEQQLSQLRHGALLHDVGLLKLPDALLLKPGPLTADEWAEMRKHPTYAQELLTATPQLRPALEVAYAHHEHWDGGGYPRGLQGEQIPIAARVFAAADAWDALTSDRPWRRAWTAEQTRAHFEAESGKQFDPRVVEVLLRLKAEG